jgi:hypothetical protein
MIRSPALKGRNLISLALQRQVGSPIFPIRPEGAVPLATVSSVKD